MKNFNYQEQLLRWKKEQLILRRKYMDTPPGFSSEEEAGAAWAAYEAEYAAFLEQNRLTIEDVHLPDVSFPLIGREEELAAIYAMLDSFHTAFLYGIGGIGKTSIALSYIQKHRSAYDHVIHVVANKGILQAVCDDVFVPVSTLRYDRKRYPSLKLYFQEKLDALRQISENERLLIVVDNMNRPADRALQQFLELPCDKILTTRINYELVPEEQKLLVDSLKAQYWPELIRLYSNDSAPSETERLLRYGQQVKGHTLSMKLASVQASCTAAAGRPDELYDITTLLSDFRLKKTELQALLFLSILAPQGIERALFLQVSGVSETTLASLQNYLLVDAFGSILRVHPLIAEAAKKLMPPTCIRCSPLLRGFENYLYGEKIQTSTWHRTYEENRALEPHIFALYEAFPQPAAWLGTAFEEIVTFLWIQGYYKEALSYAIKVYEAVMEYYGPTHALSGREALRVAAVYHNSMDHENALLWYLKGYELLKTVAPRTFDVLDQLSTACSKLAREYSHRRNSAAQKKYADEFKEIFQEMLRLYGKDLTEQQKAFLPVRYHHFLVEEGKHALREGRVEDAKKIYESAEHWMEGHDQDMAYRNVSIKELQIRILIRENRLAEAEDAARENVQYALLYRGEKYKDYLANLEVLSDILCLEQKKDEAYRLYEQILIRLYQDYPYEIAWRRNIEEKMGRINDF